MKKIRVSEATGPVLNWLVAKCAGLLDQWGVCAPVGFRPSTDWAQGGPIIEREDLSVGRELLDGPCTAFGKCGVRGEGPTPLIAAMRCYVASKLGDEVEIPEELK